MSREITVKSDCPHCGNPITTKVDVPESVAPPDVRCENLLPVGNLYVYRISSEQIKQYLTDKVRQIVPATKLDLAPQYTERKRRHKTDPLRSYSSLNVALSDDVIVNGSDDSWLSTIGLDNKHVTIIDSMYRGIVEKFRYDPKVINEWLKDYKIMEHLEESFGITEDYLQAVKRFASPQRVVTNDKKSWVFFAAAPEKIIYDMLTDRKSGKLKGKMVISQTLQISKYVVEYIVQVDPTAMELKEDPYVRQILETSEIKAKK